MATFDAFMQFVENPFEGLMGMRQQQAAAGSSLANPLIQQAEQERATRDYEAASSQLGIVPGSLDKAFGIDGTGFNLDTGAQGLLVDPRFQDNATEIRYATNLLNNPGTSALGTSILQSVLTGQAQTDVNNEKEQTRINELEQARGIFQSNREQDFTRRKADRADTRANQLVDRDATIAAADERSRLTREATAGQRGRDNQISKPPAGYQRLEIPGRGVFDVPIPGSKPYAERQAKVDAGIRSVDLIDDMLAQFEEFGQDEMLNRGAIREFDNNRAQMQADIFQLQGRGAPQSFEQELLDKQFPSISDFWNIDKASSYQNQRNINLQVLEDLANDPTMPEDQRLRIQSRLRTESQKKEDQANKQGLTNGPS
jgi:hypothetical protein